MSFTKAPRRGINPPAESQRMLKQPVSVFHVPVPRLLPGNEKPQSGDRIQPGVSAPGCQATPPISALKGRRKTLRTGLQTPSGKRPKAAKRRQNTARGANPGLPGNTTDIRPEGAAENAADGVANPVRQNSSENSCLQAALAFSLGIYPLATKR